MSAAIAVAAFAAGAVVSLATSWLLVSRLERAGERRVLNARPSDAIALALRAFGAEIYVSEQVMSALGMPGHPDN